MQYQGFFNVVRNAKGLKNNGGSSCPHTEGSAVQLQPNQQLLLTCYLDIDNTSPRSRDWLPHLLYLCFQLLKGHREGSQSARAVQDCWRIVSDAGAISADNRKTCLPEYFAYRLHSAFILGSPKRIQIHHQHHTTRWQAGILPKPQQECGR